MQKNISCKIYLPVIVMMLIALSGCVQETIAPLPTSDHQEEATAHQFDLETKELTAIYDKTYSELNDSVKIPEGVSVNVKISIPQVKNVENSLLATQLNEYFFMEGNALLLKAAEYLGTPDLKKNTEIVVDWTYEVAQNDGEWLSIRRQGYINAGGAYPTTVILGDNIRLIEGKPIFLSLDDLFSLPSEEYKKILIDNIEVISNGNFPREALEGYFDFNSFYLTKEYLVIFYQEDTLGPHAIGTPEFEIPLENLKDIWVK